MKKWDLIILITAISLFALFSILLYTNRKEGAVVVVSVDGTQTAVYPLNTDMTVRLEGYDGGYNTLVIRGGQADITDADCADLTCVHQKPISADHETIVCLPHRVVIEIRSNEENETDAVAR